MSLMSSEYECTVQWGGKHLFFKFFSRSGMTIDLTGIQVLSSIGDKDLVERSKDQDGPENPRSITLARNYCQSKPLVTLRS